MVFVGILQVLGFDFKKFRTSENLNFHPWFNCLLSVLFCMPCLLFFIHFLLSLHVSVLGAGDEPIYTTKAPEYVVVSNGG